MTSEPRPVRFRVELFARLTAAGVQGEKVRVLDLSETGAFLERTEELDELQEDDPLTLTLSFPGIGKWKARATVSRLGTSRLELKRPGVAHLTVVREGFGLAFDPLSEEQLEQLRDFLELLDER